MAMKIGFSACYFHSDATRAVFKGKTLLYLEKSIPDWLFAQGALGFMVPPASGLVSVESFAEELDGLILQGGSDVSPESYGEKPLKPEWQGDRIRDLYEIDLIRAFIKAKKPILGVCRGLQILNVALGGTLIQDIGTQIPHSFEHRNWDIYDQNFHEVRFEKNSKLERIYQTHSGKVNSVHHQCIQKLSPSLKAEAWSIPDGIIEAISGISNDSYVYAVQWHPEFNTSGDHCLNNKIILNDFLRACSR